MSRSPVPSRPDPDLPSPGTPDGDPRIRLPRRWSDRVPSHRLEASPVPPGAIPWRRLGRALIRFRWIPIASVLIAAGIATALIRTSTPTYTVTGALWITSEGSSGPAEGATGGLLRRTAWIDLLRSAQVMDTVVVRLGLHIRPADPALQPVLREAGGSRVTPGSWRLRTDGSGERWRLEDSRGALVEEGMVGDSVGRAIGLEWLPDDPRLRAHPEISFDVVSPSDASRELNGRLEHSLNPEQANFLRVFLSGEDPEEITRILDGILDRHVEAAEALKRNRVAGSVERIGSQLGEIRAQLAEADRALEVTRSATILLPADPLLESSGPAGSGDPPVLLEIRREESLRTARAEEARRIREGLSRLDASGDVTILASLARSGGGTFAVALEHPIRDLEELLRQERELRSTLTPQHPALMELQRRIRILREETIPDLTEDILEALRGDIERAETRRAALERTIREAPARSIETLRLQRQQLNLAEVEREIRQRFEAARLASATLSRDVEVLDRPTVPSLPSHDPRPRTAALALLIGLAAGLVGAVGADRIDPRIRDPEQVMQTLGMDVLGVVPRVLPGDSKRGRESRGRIVEAFRDLRLHVEYAHGVPGPLALAVTSPGAGEGKTLVCANLALAFAERGQRTLLIDGDTRQGDLHRMLGVDRTPGLVEVLADDLPVDHCIVRTRFPRLELLPSGDRRPTSPELLAGARIRTLLEGLRARYDVVVIDTPPLAAGVDPLILAALVGNLALVLRSGTSDARVLAARLRSAPRFPIRILGAILNDAGEAGTAAYGTYLPGYGIESESVSIA